MIISKENSLFKIFEKFGVEMQGCLPLDVHEELFLLLKHNGDADPSLLDTAWLLLIIISNLICHQLALLKI